MDHPCSVTVECVNIVGVEYGKQFSHGYDKPNKLLLRTTGSGSRFFCSHSVYFRSPLPESTALSEER